MSKKVLTEDTLVEIGKSISISQFRAFFEQTTGTDLSGWCVLCSQFTSRGRWVAAYSNGCRGAKVYVFGNA